MGQMRLNVLEKGGPCAAAATLARVSGARLTDSGLCRKRPSLPPSRAERPSLPSGGSRARAGTRSSRGAERGDSQRSAFASPGRRARRIGSAPLGEVRGRRAGDAEQVRPEGAAGRGRRHAGFRPGAALPAEPPAAPAPPGDGQRPGPGAASGGVRCPRR